MTKHTPEPWTIKRALAPVDGAYDWAIGAEIDDAGPYCIGEVVGRAAEDVWLPSKANAARIVACVNACAGVPTAALENGAVKTALEALEQIIECRHARRGGGPLPGDLQDMDEALRDVIEIASSALAQLKEDG